MGEARPNAGRPLARWALALLAVALTAALTACGTSSPATRPFTLEIHYASAVDPAEQAAFAAAAAHWERIITAGLPDVPGTIPAHSCAVATGLGELDLPETDVRGIDDLRIDVWVGPIDGVGGVLGSGGPCYYRDSDGLPVYAVMALDADDAAAMAGTDLLEITALHEMGHALGIGAPGGQAPSMWTSLLADAATDRPSFVGANATREWQALQVRGGVPVENCIDSLGRTISSCGAATRLVHWREATLGNELMTGWLAPGANPVSRVTVGALQDMGYAVDYSQADVYLLPIRLQSATSELGRQDVFEFIQPRGTLPSAAPAARP